MPRPIKQVVDYFPHFASASNGRTMFILESQYGNDGYAFWFKVLELLSSTKGHYYDFNNPPDWEFLLAKTRVSADIAKNILNTLMILGAIDQELYSNNVLWCQNLIDNLEPLYDRRKSKLPQKPRFCEHKLLPTEVSTNINPINTSQKPQSKVKDSIVEKIRDDKKISSPTGEKVKEVFLKLDNERGYRPPKRNAEAASILRMLKTYTPNQILGAYKTLKQDKFWQGKELYMMSVESQIGAMVKDGTHRGNPRKVRAHDQFTTPEENREKAG